MGNNKKTNNILLGLAFILVIAIIIGIFTGQFAGESKTVTDQTIINILESPDELPTSGCGISVNPPVSTFGDEVTITIQEGPFAFCELFGNKDGTGWLRIFEGTTDVNGFLRNRESFFPTGDYVFRAICNLGASDACITPPGSLTVNPQTTTPPPTTPPAGPQVDDVLDTSSGSGTLNGPGKDWDVSPYGLSDEPGPIIIGVKIQREWDYVHPENAAMCYSQINFLPTVDWVFFDSAGLRWEAHDNDPTAAGVRLCPVSWDKFSPWRFELVNTKPLPGCEINYDWDLQVIVCEVLEQ